MADDDDLAFDFEGSLEKAAATYQGASVSVFAYCRHLCSPARHACEASVSEGHQKSMKLTPPPPQFPHRPAPAAKRRTSRPAPSWASR
jgi:hypothetical protein